MIVGRLNGNPVVIQRPIGLEDTFRGIGCNLFTLEAQVSDTGDLGATAQIIEIPANIRAEVTAARFKMIERSRKRTMNWRCVISTGEKLDIETLRAALRRATVKGICTPVLCGTSLRNKGVQPMLDAVVMYLPSPLDIPSVTEIDPRTGEETERPAKDDAPFAALVFKIVTDSYVGPIGLFPRLFR